jgi:hypothetical protein
MARPTDRNRFRKDAEARFPIKIDIAVAAMLLASGVMLSSCATETPKSVEQMDRLHIIDDPYNPIYIVLFETNSAVVGGAGQAAACGYSH